MPGHLEKAYLGVMISSDLSWSLHISLTCCKLKRFLGFMYRNSSYLSHLKALVLWDPHQVYNIEKLESVQGFVAKLATRKWSKNTTDLGGKLSWPSLASRRLHCKLCATVSFLTVPSFPLLFLFLCPQLLVVI